MGDWSYFSDSGNGSKRAWLAQNPAGTGTDVSPFSLAEHRTSPALTNPAANNQLPRDFSATTIASYAGFPPDLMLWQGGMTPVRLDHEEVPRISGSRFHPSSPPSLPLPNSEPDPFGLSMAPSEEQLQVFRDWESSFKVPAQTRTTPSSSLGRTLLGFQSINSLSSDEAAGFTTLSTNDIGLPQKVLELAMQSLQAGRTARGEQAEMESSSETTVPQTWPFAVATATSGLEATPEFQSNVFDNSFLSNFVANLVGTSNNLATGAVQESWAPTQVRVNIENHQSMEDGEELRRNESQSTAHQHGSSSTSKGRKPRGRPPRKAPIAIGNNRTSSARSPTPHLTPPNNSNAQEIASTDSIPPKVLTDLSRILFAKEISELTPEELQVCVGSIMVRRARNTESARRSRVRRQEQMDSSEGRIEELVGENEGLKGKVRELEGRLRTLGEEV